MNIQTDHVERITDQGRQTLDPKTYIANASMMLAQARDSLIKAESMHMARRSSEIVAFNDRLQRLDADHDKLVQEYSRMIVKLEDLRS